jgi:drug/metabolite transporter (DMT)-like permease
MAEILLVLLTGLFTAAAQLLLKSTAAGIRLDRGIPGLLASLKDPRLTAGIILGLGAPLLYFRALLTLPLSLAFSLAALSYVWVPAGAAMLLRERIRPLQFAGISLIAAGLGLWGLG